MLLLASLMLSQDLTISAKTSPLRSRSRLTTASRTLMRFWLSVRRMERMEPGRASSVQRSFFS